jgi:SRSO17 transposase
MLRECELVSARSFCGPQLQPQEVEFQTKPEIALDQIRAAVEAQVPRGVVLADAAYGINTEFRDALSELGLPYVVGVQSSMTVWEPGKQADR